MVANRKKVAAMLGVLRYLQQERERGERSASEHTASPWALSGRRSQMRAPEDLMRQRVLGSMGTRGAWSRSL